MGVTPSGYDIQRIQLNIRTTPAFKTAITSGRCVVRIRACESVLLPSQASHFILNRVQNHMGVLDPREVDVLGKIIYQLFQSDVIPGSAS
jgi:hypothetical protein